MIISLDFHLDGVDERLDYLSQYIKQDVHYTADNLETMANYILWADEKENNTNYQIDSKHSPWVKQRNDLSYEGLLEQETGAPWEASLLGNEIAKPKKTKLDRNAVVKKLWEKTAPSASFIYKKDTRADPNQPYSMPEILPFSDAPAPQHGSNFVFREEEWHPLTCTWFDLWWQIDKTEFQVQTWELTHGKRRPDLPIREELHHRLDWGLWYKNSPETLSQLEEKLEEESALWDGYTYLKKKRNLVQLRTQQYGLLECTGQETLLRHINMGIYWNEEERGLRNFYPFMGEELLIDEVREEHFEKEFQKKCVDWLRYADKVDRATSNVIDLRQPEVVRNLLFYRDELGDNLPLLTVQDREVTEMLLRYLDYYVNKCGFTDELKYILIEKMRKVSNKEIAKAVEEKFNLSYKENYISTIFTRRIVEPIVEQVEKHYRMIEYLTMGRTVFKKCSICGRLLPRNSTYFNKRTATSDGFFSYCKECKARRKS